MYKAILHSHPEEDKNHLEYFASTHTHTKSFIRSEMAYNLTQNYLNQAE